MWRFIQISDPQFGLNTDVQGLNRIVCSMMPEVTACLRRDLAQLAPDFVLATGDICCVPERDAMFGARDLLDSLRVPYYPMGGNMDFVSESSRDWFLEAFQARLPIRDTVFSITHKGLHFCMLDAWWRWPDGALCPFWEGDVKEARWAVPPHQLRWLEHDLEAHANEPTLVVSHYPAIPIPERRRNEGVVDPGCLENGELLLTILARFPQVKGIISGHSHLHFVERLGPITQIVTAGLPEYPVEVRVFEVRHDRIDVRLEGLSDSIFAEHSLLDGRGWAAGDEIDRVCIISLGSV